MRMNRVLLAVVAICFFPSAGSLWAQQDWGSDHVDLSLPEFVDGELCLFCHRDTIGTTWQDNIHARTIQASEDAYRMGRENINVTWS